MLYVVSTPIGNLEDITLRAIRILGEASLIAAEDTRHTKKLLSHYQIHTPMISYHEHNKVKRTSQLIEKLKEGLTLALVTDSGTPGVSDPGFYLIRKAIEENISVVPIPGATACIAALVTSGCPTDKFLFVGFLPVKKGKRKKMLQELIQCPYTKIIYESPHRLLTLLELLNTINPGADVVVSRELTKKFEEIFRGNVGSVYNHFQDNPPRGEIVVLF